MENQLQNFIDHKLMKKDSKWIKKNKFSGEEDTLLKTLFEIYGSDWKKISDEIKTKSAKQCRNRWNMYLNPNINNNPLSNDEEKSLIFWVERCGTNWALIHSLFPGRTPSCLKNHFITYCSRNNIDIKDFHNLGKEVRKEKNLKKKTL